MTKHKAAKMSSGDCQVKRRKRSVIKEEEAAASAGGLHPQPAQPLPPSAAVADELLCETRADSPLPVLDVQPKTEPSPIPLAPDREIEGDDDEAYLERIPNYLNRHLWRYVVRPREVIPEEALDDGDSPEQLLHHLVAPCGVQEFVHLVFGDHAMLVQRPQNRGFFSSWYSKAAIEELLRTETLHYGTNVDVTHFDGQARITYNSNAGADGGADDEAVDPAVLWRRYQAQGCSVRLLHPQRWCAALAARLARLEEVFQSCVGCNAYLTPPGSQGFAPHWDDIDAFVLQIEGAKRWRLHPHLDEGSKLPRFSSADFAPKDLAEPFLDTVLEPGDLLYMPRGSIHQAETVQGSHSLHLTISVCQRKTMADLLEIALPRALALAAEECTFMRQTLGANALNYLGVAVSDTKSAFERCNRAALQATADQAMEEVVKRLSLDAAADRMAVAFLQQRLPPQPTSVAPGIVSPRRLRWKSMVRLRGKGLARLVVEEDSAVVYHCLQNSRSSHASGQDGAASDAGPSSGASGADERGRLEFDLERAPALEALLLRLPGPEGGCTMLRDALPGRDGEDLAVAQKLFEAGIIVELAARGP